MEIVFNVFLRLIILGAEALLWSGVLYFVFSAVGWCSLIRLYRLFQIHRLLKKIPDGVLLICQGRTVAAVQYNADGSERHILLWKGIMTWHGSRKNVTRLRRPAKLQMLLRVPVWSLGFAFMIVVEINIIKTYYESASDYWLHVILWPFFFLCGQFMPFYVYERPSLSAILFGE